MLAERKRKTRYVLNPIKKPLWTTDSRGIKFGKELMEKMGWSAGKGLGANEQGIQEPLRVFSKNDTKGMGYKKNEENWIEYQDEFNILLNQLASNTDNNAKTKEVEKSQIMSLEAKSKLSKARVHYQKFTRGKDISKYSESDLSCILGIGKLKKAISETSIGKEISSENNLGETHFGVTTINSGSIKDYFKKKLALNNLNVENSSLKQLLSAEQQISENTNVVLKKKSNKRQKESSNEFLHIANGDGGNENTEIKKHRKKKKLNLEEEKILRKKEKSTCEIDVEIQNGEENPVGVENSHENISSDSISKSKEKKKKKRECVKLKVELKYQSEVPVDEKVNNKRKKKESENSRNRYKEEVDGNVMEEEPQNETLKEILKKSRKKEKRAEKSPKTDSNAEVEVSEGTASEKLKNITEVVPEKNPSRKKKLKVNVEFQDKDKNNFKQSWEDPKSQLENDIEEELITKRKKKKRKKVFLQKEEIKNADEREVEEFQREVNIGKEKKKKKEKGSKESSEEQINEESLEVEMGNKTVEKKLIKKKKKYLEESNKEEEKLTNKKFLVEEVAVAAALAENKGKKKSKICAETESQPEEERKRTGKSKKEGVEHKGHQLQGNILESQEKMSKEKKDKTKSEPHLDNSGGAKGIENQMSNNEKENKNKGVDLNGEEGEKVIHTHKTSLFHMKKPFLGNFKNCTTSKVLNLICGAEIERFKGANLGDIPGYGYRKIIEKNIER